MPALLIEYQQQGDCHVANMPAPIAKALGEVLFLISKRITKMPKDMRIKKTCRTGCCINPQHKILISNKSQGALLEKPAVQKTRREVVWAIRFHFADYFTSVRDAAAKLNCSRSTVSRLRNNLTCKDVQENEFQVGIQIY
jgi:hypothetical protein